MTEPKQAAFDGWAIVEIFGHQKAVGFVTTEAYGSAVLFRVDTPEMPEREYVLSRPQYTTPDASNREQKWTPAGAKVKRMASPASSQLLGPGSIYRLIPCTEETARKAIEELIERPLILLELPKQQAPLLPGETLERRYACCGGTPEIGHRFDCENAEEQDAELVEPEA